MQQAVLSDIRNGSRTASLLNGSLEVDKVEGGMMLPLRIEQGDGLEARWNCSSKEEVLGDIKGS